MWTALPCPRPHVAWRDDQSPDAVEASEMEDMRRLNNSESAWTTVSVTLERQGTLGYGLVLDHKGEPPDKIIWIAIVRDGLAAHQCGRLQPGDLLIEVEGRNTKWLELEQVLEVLAEHRRCAFVFLRRRKPAGVQAILDASETTGLDDRREQMYAETIVAAATTPTTTATE